ncbi:Nardilysin (Narginine dibasic convertase) [Caligus rogercresseyi]|uniref:Nardilysin (Narginine dibasic convertase) n=1 Tax=Caligus rogercresseyi TaxID=217165 RepID=A0A7T8HKX4_CALRO|nr:Nardilysin (Narginine dibasic convertase) [Caligus rogercresseyi]
MNLSAGNSGNGFEMNSTFSSFLLTVELTAKGFKEYDKVIGLIYSYLAMLVKEGPSERIFKEIQRIEQLDFDFGDEELPLENVQTICENMQFYEPERYLDGDTLMFEYDAEILHKSLEFLYNSSDVNVIFMAREFAEMAKEEERWFGSKYSVEDISPEQLEKWKSTPILPEFHLPEVNKYIAEDTSLKTVPKESLSDYPIRILKDDAGELFYKKDQTFELPRAVIYFHFCSDLLMQGKLEDSVCLDIMVNCIVLLMVEDTYAADLAQLHSEFFSSERGIVLKINGLNDKCGLLLSEIVKHLKSLETDLCKSKFEAVKEQTKKSYFNYFIKPPKVARDLRLSLLQNVFHGAQQRHSVIDDIDIERLKSFAGTFKKQIYIQGLVQGNVSPDEAKDYFQVAKGVLGESQTIPFPQEIRCNEIPLGEKFMRVKGLHPKDSNTIVTNYYQHGPGNIRTHALLEILCLAMEEPVFDVLRSKEQLGTGSSPHSETPTGFSAFLSRLTLRSSRIEAFLKHFHEAEILPMPKEKFADYVDTLIKMKKAADVTLEEEMSRNWSEIVSQEYVFDRNAKEAQLYESNAFSLKDLHKIMEDLFLNESTLRKLSVQVLGAEDGNTCESETEEDLPNKKYSIQLLQPLISSSRI